MNNTHGGQVEPITDEQHSSNPYDLFILGLTVISLFTLVILLLPFIRDEAKEIALFIDTIIAFMFLVDFFYTLYRAKDRLAYMRWGWMDLLGSLPGVPAFRILRLWRIVRFFRLTGRASLRDLIFTFLKRPAGSSLMVVSLIGLVLLGVSSYLILVTEHNAPGANITSAADAIWWSLVSVTTVGYGDRFPVTVGGRVVAVFLMLAGIGLFSVLTSYLSSTFVGQDEEQTEREIAALREQVSRLRAELSDMHQLLQRVEEQLTDTTPEA
jgi:voltage-gated potassium channel